MVSWRKILLFAPVLVMTCQSCGGYNSTYKGDGVLTHSSAPFFGLLWPDVYEIQMPRIDISKHCFYKYKLDGIPLTEERSRYSAFLVIPSADYLKYEDRMSWGWGRFEIMRNNDSIQSFNSTFDLMINNYNGKYNRLYIEKTGASHESLSFVVTNKQDCFELIFECSGCDSPEPIWAYILIHSGGK
jgi:hypothetical protein